VPDEALVETVVSGMREPTVLPMEDSPFDLSVSGAERQRRMERVADDVVTDEAGLMVGFQRGDDVEALLTDRRFGAVAMTTLGFSGVTDGPLHELWSLLMFGKEGDEHRRLRSTVSGEFTPKRVERYRPYIERDADALAAGLTGTVELWSDFALPLSARAACRIVGIPDTDADMVGQWGVDLVGAFFLMDDDMRTRAEAAALAFCHYLDSHLEALRSNPGDDVASLLLGSDGGDHDLSPEELRALVANLVFGGLEATAKVITTGVYHLLVEDQWKALVARPDMASHAVDELLRFSPPIGPARVTTDDAEVRDVPLCAGQLVMLNIEAACRDEQHYDDPEVLDITRDPGRQLAFGAGPHYCLGANLAKVVLETAFVTLARRFPDLSLADDGQEVVWDHNTFHGIVSLPVGLVSLFERP
jgi:cytochrome P450